jgi:hypothetical protein
MMNQMQEYQEMIPPSANHATDNTIVATGTGEMQAARQPIR